MGMIDAYCVDSITIIKAGGAPTWGEPAATTEVDVKGKIEYKTRLIRDLTGEQVVTGTKGAVMSSVMVLLPESIETDSYLGRALSHEDKLKFNSIEHVILKIDKPKAFSNPHYEVYVS
jgi:hypothetical protein